VNALHPVHRSLQGRIGHVRPHNMEHIPCTPEQAEAVERIAIEIFNDVCNAGGTFQSALAACYISGLSHAQELTLKRVALDQQTPLAGPK
jgi:hypothetical protein